MVRALKSRILIWWENKSENVLAKNKNGIYLYYDNKHDSKIQNGHKKITLGVEKLQWSAGGGGGEWA